MTKTEQLDAEMRLLAAIAYGESSTANLFEEMAAIASVMVRQRKARGYDTIKAFTAKDKTFSFVVRDGNPRFAKLMKASEEKIAKSKSMSLAVQAARNAMDGGIDHSNRAFFWDGADIKSNYADHFKVNRGIKFSDPSHNIYGIEESRELVVKDRVRKIKVNGKIEFQREELWRYDHVYQSTTAHGGTIFWKQNPEYLKHTRSKEHL